jgi:hypothetical protein
MPTSDIKKGPLYVDSTNNRVGIKTVAPDLALHVEGTNAAPASSGNTPTGFVSLRQKDGGSSHGANIGVLGVPPWGTWIQGQDANNLATNYPLLLNPNGGSVGIGAFSPSQELHIKVGDGAQVSTPTGLEGSVIRLENNMQWESAYGTSGGDFLGGLEFASGDDSTGTGVRAAIKTTVDTYYNTNSLAFYTAPQATSGVLERMRIDSSGRVTMPYQPSFRASNAPATSTNATLVYGTVNTNIGGHYNTSNGRYTAPVAGVYLFTMSMLFPTTGTSYARILFAVNGTASTNYADTLTSAGDSYLSLNGSTVIGLSAGDYVTVVNDGQITSYGTGYGSFCGYLIG